MFGWQGSPGSGDDVYADFEAKRLAAEVNPNPVPDPADQRAEQMTRRARLVLGIGAVIGLTWFVAGPGWAAVAAAVVGIVVLALVLRRRAVRRGDAGS
jgi:membrane associated rhomboid family serine protease